MTGEQKCPQKLVFYLEIGWDNRSVVRSNDVAACLSYADVSEALLSLVNSKYVALVERVDKKTTERLMIQFKLPWIRVKIGTPEVVPQAANVGMVIACWRQKV